MTFIAKINNLFSKIESKYVYTFFAVLALGITCQNYFIGPKYFYEGGQAYTHYNNYIIFRQSFFHLSAGKNLYLYYPDEYWDLYKYSPSFPVLFSPLFIMPMFIGLFFWNLINVLSLAWAVNNIKILKDKKAYAILIFLFFEFMTSIQNSQSNALMAALLIGAYNYLEDGKSNKAAFLIAISFYIKIFGGIGFLLFLFYKPSVKKFLQAAVIFIVIGFLPLVLISLEQLKYLYLEWLKLLQMDHDTSLGVSVQGFFSVWFNLSLNKIYTLLAGIILLMTPLLNFKNINNSKQILNLVALILIWLIIFNHKAESATFIIAMTGAGIWYFSNDENSKLNTVLIVLCFVFGSMSSTDMFPRFVRVNYFQPYVVKVIPYMLLFGKILYDLLVVKAYSKQNSK